jgi:hypothetical protein
MRATPLVIALALVATAAPAETIYQLEFEAAKDLAREVMVEAHGANKVNEWIERSRTTFSVSGGGVIRGGWSWGISVRPVNGLTADGRKVSGVLFEPHASHGPGTGKGQYTEDLGDKLLATATARADKTGKGIAVAKLIGAPDSSASATPTVPTALSNEAEEIAARLRALKSLLDSGAITAAEYEAKKKELLARF